MSSVRSILFGLALMLLFPLLFSMGAVAYTLWELPSQGDKVRGDYGLVGVQTRGSYVWLIPEGDGVVLVDAGADPEAEAVLREVRGRPIRAVVLTHGHAEQVAGLAEIVDVPVYVGEADVDLLLGKASPKGQLAQLFDAVTPDPEIDADRLHPVADGQEITVGEVRLRAIHTPGHTAGSIVWMWQDVLFTGGALVANNPPRLFPSPLSDDVEQARASLDKLLPLDFDRIADGQIGTVTSGRVGLFRMLGHKPFAPTVRLRPPLRPGVDSGPEVEREGLYLQTPSDWDPVGAAARLLLDDGTEWLLSPEPVPEHASFIGRRVVVKGRLLSPAASAGSPGGLVLDLDAVQLVDEDASAAPSRVHDRASLEAAAGSWAQVEGTIHLLSPLMQGASHGEGVFTLKDGTQVPMSAPMSILHRSAPADIHGDVDGEIEEAAPQPPAAPPAAQSLLARVVSERGALRIVAQRPCDDATSCL